MAHCGIFFAQFCLSAVVVCLGFHFCLAVVAFCEFVRYVTFAAIIVFFERCRRAVPPSKAATLLAFNYNLQYVQGSHV
jgi:hypothetical protein